MVPANFTPSSISVKGYFGYACILILLASTEPIFSTRIHTSTLLPGSAGYGSYFITFMERTSSADPDTAACEIVIVKNIATNIIATNRSDFIDFLFIVSYPRQ